MRHIIVIIAIALMGVGMAMAQAPRKINYQGRAQDAGGPIKTPRNVSLALYADSLGTGGSLWTEAHPNVKFTDGVFTIVIGSVTPLPTAFDRQYWIGVTIQGVNANAELPRLPLLATPYALHAEIAENAKNAATAVNAETANTAIRANKADTATVAKSLLTPLTITPVSTNKSATLTVSANPGGTAIASNGVDSTSQHFVSGETLGTTGRSAPGGYYRDNAPLAWAVVSQSGTQQSGFGIDSVAIKGGGTQITYEVTLHNPVQPGEAAPVITAFSLDVPIIAVWSYKGGVTETRTIVVELFNVRIQPPQNVQSAFSIVIFGRPQ